MRQADDEMTIPRPDYTAVRRNSSSTSSCSRRVHFLADIKATILATQHSIPVTPRKKMKKGCTWYHIILPGYSIPGPYEYGTSLSQISDHKQQQTKGIMLLYENQRSLQKELCCELPPLPTPNC